MLFINDIVDFVSLGPNLNFFDELLNQLFLGSDIISIRDQFFVVARKILKRIKSDDSVVIGLSTAS